MHEIEQQLKDIESTLQRIESTYPDIARTAAQARYVYDLAYATAIDEIEHRALAEGQKKPTVAAMESEAVLMVQSEMHTARMAEAELNIAKVLINSLDSRLSATQTRAGFAKIEMGLVR